LSPSGGSRVRSREVGGDDELIAGVGDVDGDRAPEQVIVERPELVAHPIERALDLLEVVRGLAVRTDADGEKRVPTLRPATGCNPRVRR
jgi:alkanesulfonate monooxygenase SsuD/methylene tetrahydromethanopterin reductase-like flavin-dependent oxidoreductase (luciferase family)